MRDGSVVLQPHDPRWEDAFAFESGRLAKKLGQAALAVHHVGSTAIPKICAKPILDLLLVAPSLGEIDQRKSAFEELGYEYKGEYGIPGRRYCVLYNPEKTKGFVHIHAFPADHVEVHQHILFRDYLRAHPEIAAQYEKIKLALLDSNVNRSNYTTRKAPFIKETLLNAEKWRQSV